MTTRSDPTPERPEARILYACQRCGEEVGEGEQNRGRCPHCGCRSLDPIGTIEEDERPEGRETLRREVEEIVMDAICDTAAHEPPEPEASRAAARILGMLQIVEPKPPKVPGAPTLEEALAYLDWPPPPPWLAVLGAAARSWHNHALAAPARGEGLEARIRAAYIEGHKTGVYGGFGAPTAEKAWLTSSARAALSEGAQ